MLRATACGSVAIAAALVGCSKKEEAAAGRRVPARAPRRPPPRRLRPRRRPLKIAFAYLGPVGDGGWTFAHDNGRKALEKELGAKVQTTLRREACPSRPTPSAYSATWWRRATR